MSAEFALTSYPLAPPVRSVNFLEFVYVLTQRVAWWQPYFFIKLDRKEIVHSLEIERVRASKESRICCYFYAGSRNPNCRETQGNSKLYNLYSVIVCQQIDDFENFHIECVAIASMHQLCFCSRGAWGDRSCYTGLYFNQFLKTYNSKP